MTGPCRLAGPADLALQDLGGDEWVPTARRLYQAGAWFEGLWGRAEPRPEVTMSWGVRGRVELFRLECPDGKFPSLTAALPASDWFERAVRDRTGLVPVGHVDPRPFLYHETYPPDYREGQPLADPPGERRWDYPFLRHEGPGVFEIPVGPIHAGVIEPGHFRFTTAGEIILDLEARLNYTHKGTLTLARGQPLGHALRLLERLSGDNAAAHACAFASACEAALELEVDPGLQDLRTALVELERLHNHVWDLGGVGLVTAFQAGAAHFHALREELLRWNARLFAHRLLMNAVAVGGLHREPPPAPRAEFLADLPRLRRHFEAAVHLVADHSGVKERIEGTGTLARASAELLGCVGPPARASGIPRDARVDAPSLAYPRWSIEPVTRDRGDVASRMWVKIEEARRSFELVEELLAGSPPHAPVPAPAPGAGDGLAFVEASRGAVLSWVRVADGRVADVYQRDPSFLNWRGLQQAVFRNIIPDFPLINKSFNLSYSGSDA